MIVTTELLQGAVPGLERVEFWATRLAPVLSDYCISDTPERLAAYIAVTAHETGNYTNLEENLNYTEAGLVKTWPERFNKQTAGTYAHNSVVIANRAYANRMGNGPESSGDGYRYRGRGLIQLTGKDNYLKYGYMMELDLLNKPDLLAQPNLAIESSAIFWTNHNLNDLADAGNFQELRRIVNGGTIGMTDYLKRLDTALTYLRSL
jgi:putative chitinase